MNRRTLLKSIAHGSLAASIPTPIINKLPDLFFRKDAANKPNILLIMVDQMREMQWDALAQKLPNITALRAESIKFGSYYTAANMCEPARSSIVTGLYGHQHLCLVTQQSHLHPDFLTYGDGLRDVGYYTRWMGKWHLSEDSSNFDPYGFSGSIKNDPVGAPAQGQTRDPQIAQEFIDWLPTHDDTKPWCCTVSFVNPHDIMWYPRFTEAIPQQKDPPSVYNNIPANYETPQELNDRKKPKLQTASQTIAAQGFGSMRYSGVGYKQEWIEYLDLYLHLQTMVDEQIGRVLAALNASKYKQNTIVIFTADHGEYCGSHGMRGKGAGVYEEAIHVPFCIKDPTGAWVANTSAERTQLVSSVDLAPLLLTLGYGDNTWRSDAKWQHLANRLDITQMMKNTAAKGRDFILHTTDEPGYEEAPARFVDDTASHVVAYRTAQGKVASYSYWEKNSINISTYKQEHEGYNYANISGRAELDNMAIDPSNSLYTKLLGEMNNAINTELRQPLPANLQDVQAHALEDYLKIDNGEVYRINLPFLGR